jgi:hypothetical protein
MKEVQFRWSYQDLPEVLNSFLAFTGTGEATMRLYDDGWRIANLSIVESDAAPPRTASQKKQIQAFKETEWARQRAAAAEAERRAAEHSRRLAESQTPTRTIGEYKHYENMGDGSTGDKWKLGIIKLTDVGFSLVRGYTTHNIGFATFTGIEIPYVNGNRYSDRLAFHIFAKLKRPLGGYSSSELGLLFVDAGDRERLCRDLLAAYKAWALKYPEFR